MVVLLAPACQLLAAVVGFVALACQWLAAVQAAAAAQALLSQQGANCNKGPNGNTNPNLTAAAFLSSVTNNNAAIAMANAEPL